LFTREIAGSSSSSSSSGSNDGSNIPMVLNLWDEFFDAAASQCLSSSSVSISIALFHSLGGGKKACSLGNSYYLHRNVDDNLK
jgi:hypothetical protein